MSVFTFAGVCIAVCFLAFGVIAWLLWREEQRIEKMGGPR